MAKEKTGAPAVHVKFVELQALLGKAEDDPAVTELLERVGMVSWQKSSDRARYVLGRMSVLICYSKARSDANLVC